MQYVQALIDAGFTRHQATAYSYLVEHGPQPSSIIARQTGVSRTLMYRILDELEEYKLVHRDDPKEGVSTFSPAHPIKLHEMVERRKKEAEQAAASISTVVDNMTSEYNKTLGKPGVVFYEGIYGMERIYNDILDHGESFTMVRTAVEPTYKEHMMPVVKEFIKKRVQKGISIDALTPLDEFTISNTKERDMQDERILFTRTLVHKKDYTAPVEIDIYGNRIALLSYGDELIGTVIESKQIAQALREIIALAKKGAEATLAEK